MSFEFQPLAIPEVILIKPKNVFHDDRGFFVEEYKDSIFRENGILYNFVQDNRSVSKKGVIRGMHYQTNPKPLAKLVRVVRGSILDVAVDIRKGSPTYGKYVSAVLSAENKHMLLVPEGFAHGLLSFEDDTEVMYKMSGEFSKEHDRSISWNDQDIGIAWPLAEVGNVHVSQKDASAPRLKDADNNFVYGKN